MKIPIFSISRTWTIASSTIVQLMRMKTFYFLIAFALLVVGIGFIFGSIDPDQASAARQLELIKKLSFGAMDLFAWLFAIVATALLIPRDLEDRTLYTILSKPVRRIEYLIGKLLGVLLLVFSSLAVMFCLCLVVLFIRENAAVAEEMSNLQLARGENIELIKEQISLIREQGVRPQLAIGALASFLKAAVVSAMAILISTFASSSLFTIISSILFFLIGHAHSMATSFWESGSNGVVKALTNLVKLFIPDFQIFSFSEGIVQGAAVAPHLVGSMCLLTAGYLFVFVLLSLVIFMYKEF